MKKRKNLLDRLKDFFAFCSEKDKDESNILWKKTEIVFESGIPKIFTVKATSLFERREDSQDECHKKWGEKNKK